MPKTRSSPIWGYFVESMEPSNGSIVICQVKDCSSPRVKRGNPTALRSKLNTSAMTDHLRKCHEGVFKEFEAKKSQAEEKKRKQEAEEESTEMENPDTPIFCLNSKKKRTQYLLSTSSKKQPTLVEMMKKTGQIQANNSSLDTGVQYSAIDSRSKEIHLLIMKRIILCQ